MEKTLESVLPYTKIVGQDTLKLALELTYIAPRLCGVLISGHRGTAKSTTVRAFTSMMYHTLPVTIPINATEDRVIGGWDIKKLLDGKSVEQQGLIQAAQDKLLYIDEINLLDDHIVNILLDVTSTNILVIQREGLNDTVPVSFTLVGTMNPEEGTLRPQLQDRFGLMVGVEALHDADQRLQILETVLAFDQALQQKRQNLPSPYLTQAHKETQQYAEQLQQARELFQNSETPSREIRTACVRLSEHFKVEGHRADYLLALAAQAHAARDGRTTTSHKDVQKIAQLVLRHRIPETNQLKATAWTSDLQQRIDEIVEQEVQHAAEHHSH